MDLEGDGNIPKSHAPSASRDAETAARGLDAHGGSPGWCARSSIPCACGPRRCHRAPAWDADWEQVDLRYEGFKAA